jgi:hypothetical protein
MKSSRFDSVPVSCELGLTRSSSHKLARVDLSQSLNFNSFFSDIKVIFDEIMRKVLKFYYCFALSIFTIKRQ